MVLMWRTLPGLYDAPMSVEFRTTQRPRFLTNATDMHANTKYNTQKPQPGGTRPHRTRRRACRHASRRSFRRPGARSDGVRVRLATYSWYSLRRLSPADISLGTPLLLLSQSSEASYPMRMVMLAVVRCDPRHSAALGARDGVGPRSCPAGARPARPGLRLAGEAGRCRDGAFSGMTSIAVGRRVSVQWRLQNEWHKRTTHLASTAADGRTTSRRRAWRSPDRRA